MKRASRLKLSLKKRLVYFVNHEGWASELDPKLRMVEKLAVRLAQIREQKRFNQTQRNRMEKYRMLKEATDRQLEEMISANSPIPDLFECNKNLLSVIAIENRSLESK